MNRRELLKLLSLGVVGHTLDIDRLLWVPGEKTIFLPAPKQVIYMGYWMNAVQKEFMERETDIIYWSQITRSANPLPWRQMLSRLTINPKEGLYVTNKIAVVRNVGINQENREDGRDSIYRKKRRNPDRNK